MKKIALFMAFAAFCLTSCSDDDNDTPPVLNNAYLSGVWVETSPTLGNYTLTFNADTAQLDREGGSTDTYTYAITQEGLTFISQENSELFSTHAVQTVNATTMKLSNMYIQTADAGTTPIITTFKKQ